MRFDEIDGDEIKVGAAETALNRAVGAVPLGNVLTNALSTYWLKAAEGAGKLGLGPLGKGTRATLTPEAQAELEAMGEAPAAGSPLRGVLDTYRQVRDTRRARDEAGAAQNPVSAGIGTGVGTALSVLAPLPAARVGSGVGGAAASGALTGAGYGALQGLTDGEADLTRGEVGKAALETAAGGALGGVLGGGVGAGVEAVRKPLGAALRRFGVRQAEQAIQGGSDIAAATRKPLSPEAAEEAILSGVIRPGATTQQIYESLEALAKARGQNLGELITRLEEQGVKGPKVQGLVDDLKARYAETWRATGSDKTVPNRFQAEADNLAAISEGGERLGLRQAEEVKRDLQQAARFERLRANPTEEALQEISSRVRQANEDAIAEAAAASPAGSSIRSMAEDFVPQKRSLGLTLEAMEAAERGAAKARQRQTVGLKDVLYGGMTGDPISGMALAQMSGALRTRVPSTLAVGGYRAGEALGRETVPTSLARGAASLSPEQRERLEAYLEALRGKR